MRQALAVLIALVFLPVPMVAQEAGVAETVRVLTDPAGDYYASLRDGPGITDPIPYYEFQDMEWLEITESADGFLFEIKVVDIEGPLDETVGFSDGGFFWIHFRHNDWDYRLEIERPSGQLEIEYFAILRGKFQDADDWGFLWRDDTNIAWDLSTDTVQFSLGREQIPDGRGAAPYPGRSLTDFWVVASQRSSSAEADFNGQTLQFPWQLQDRMPDTGIGEVTFPIMLGLTQTGHARLTSNEPYRASNGEATTFLYTVNATNQGSAPDVFGLAAVGIPNGWIVDMPLAGVSLAGGESVPVPVLVSTPFAHAHGGTAEFTLEMRSTTDTSSVGRVELGVRYLEIPQPAGHHDAIYLHSLANTQTASFNSVFAALFQPSGSVYFNTLETDDSADEVPVSAFAGLGTAEFTWMIPLEPTLRMGMDWDMDSLGQAALEIQSPLPIQDATLSGTFLLRQAGEGGRFFTDSGTPLATFGQTGVSWGPGSNQGFDLEITPLEAADYIPYAASNELWLRIELSGTGISLFNQNTVPSLQPGGWFQLPLFEYEDDISDAFDALSGARLAAVSPATRDANPGDVIVFEVDVSASDAAAGTYRLELTGQGVEWATITSPASVSAGPAPVRTTVRVDVPPGAEDGDRADLFLQAVHSSDPQRRGLIRLVVDVDTDAEHDDDSAIAGTGDDGKKNTPLPLGLGLAALGAALVLRRRP